MFENTSVFFFCVHKGRFTIYDQMKVKQAAEAKKKTPFEIGMTLTKRNDAIVQRSVVPRCAASRRFFLLTFRILVEKALKE